MSLIPDEVRRFAAHQKITLAGEIRNEGPSRVFAGERASRAVIVKLAVSEESGANEAEALTLMAQSGVTPLFLGRYGRVLAMERVHGDILADRVWGERDAVEVGRGIRLLDHLPAPEGRLTLARRTDRWRSTFGALLPRPFIAYYEQIAETVVARARHLIHADVHPKNILRQQDGRMVFVDPFGRAGPPALDLALYTQGASIEQPAAPSLLEIESAALGGFGARPSTLLESQHLVLLWRLGWAVAGRTIKTPDSAWFASTMEDLNFPLADRALSLVSAA